MLDTTENPRARLMQLVESAIDGRCYNDAVDYLLKAVADDRGARDAMMKPYERQAARELIGGVVRQGRQRIWNNAGSSVNRDASAAAQKTAIESAHPGTIRNTVSALSDGVKRTSLMDFRLHDGTPLADADKIKVLDAANHWRVKATDMAWKARWMERVADKVPNGKTVRDALDENALADMQKETRDV